MSCEGSLRELEDFIINECFSRELVKGKLDQQRRALEVHWALGRDLAPGALQTMVAQLAAWQGASPPAASAPRRSPLLAATTESVVEKLGVRIAAAAAQQAARAKEDEQVAATLKEARRHAKADLEVRGAAGAATGGLLGAHHALGGASLMDDLLGMQDAMDDGEGDAVGDRAGAGRPKRRR